MKRNDYGPQKDDTLRFTFYDQLDLHLLLLWLFTIPAAMPLLQPTITHSADGLLHLYRLVALKHTVQQGMWFPRWLPDLAYGYGFPLFIFYAPLAYYITLVLQLLGLNVISAFNGSLMLALFLAGSGSYLFVKELFGPKAGLLAGVAYVYAPFQLLNSLARGGLPAAWAMALYPFVFWIFRRLMSHSAAKPRHLISLLPIAALIFGLALLTHNTLNLLFVPLLGFYLAVEILALAILGGRASRSRQPDSEAPANPIKALKNVIIGVGGALGLGVGLAAFFLLPALVEKEFAQVQRVTISPDFDFRFNFVSLQELFSLPQPANTGLLNPEFPLTLGAVQVGLAIVGLIGLFWRIGVQSTLWTPESDKMIAENKGQLNEKSPHLPITVFTTISLAGAIFMMLPLSLPVWERLPLIAFVQLPHRFLGLAAFILAVLAGAAATALPRQPGFWLTLAGITLIFTASIPLLYQRYRDELSNPPTLLDMMAYEHRSGVIGTTSFGEYLPIWVSEIPGDSPLERMYQAGEPIQRLDLAYLPPGAVVESAHYGLNQVDLVINSPQPYQAVFHTFYFPGWTALINGEPAPLSPIGERGLISVPMPPGRNQLRLYFRETSLRQGANIISVVTLAIILAMLVINIVRRASWVTATTVNYELHPTSSFIPPQLISLAGLALLLIIVKTVYLDRFDNPLKRIFDGQNISGIDVSQHVNLGDQVNFLGYDLKQDQAMAGQSLELSAYWQARQPLRLNFSALAQLVDLEQHLYAGQDNLHPGQTPTTQWPSWGFIRDDHTILVPPGTPPGDYFLITGLYDPVSWGRLPVIEGGTPGWKDVIAIPVTVRKADKRPTVAELGIAWPVEADFGSQLKLLGATPAYDTIRRNDFLRIALFWEAKARPAANYQISLRLLASNSATVLEETLQPSHNRYPTTLWIPGERVRDNHAFWIPADFSPGIFRVQTRVLDESGQVVGVGEWVQLGVME